MRILLLSHYYRPEIGAPQRRWDALVARFVAAGHEVAVLAPSPHYPTGRALSVAPALQPGAVARGRHGEMVHRLRFAEYGRGLGGRGADQVRTAVDALATGATRFAGRHRPDVVVATVPGLPTLPAGLALGCRFGVPVVLEMRDAWPDLLTARGEWDGADAPGNLSPISRVTTAALTAAVTAMQRRAAAIVTTTDTFARVLRERGMRRVVTVRHGTDVLPAPERAGAEGDGGLRVLYAGTVGRSQGLEAAVAAVAQCQAQGVRVALRVVGAGAQLGPLRALAERLGAPVTFLPPVPAAEVGAHYAWAQTVLVPLQDWAPLRWTVPSKLYDALAAGRHVTAALAGEAADIVEQARGGDVVPPQDAGALAALWTSLAADPSRLRVGPAGRTWVAGNADDDVLAERYLGLLREVTRG